ncbi:MAG TPA: MFS transporter [Verrucomicrobiae bacterium]|nr:MFS transporter [Verrucomicrobiae bacterium]
MNTIENSPSEPTSFPPGTHNAFWFGAFNALSFPIMQNSPMVLYAKSLGASATILGIVAGMMPLLVISQIPAANHINRLGYKRFVYAGWGTRILFIIGVALVPLTGSFLDAGNRLALTIALLFCFNLSRGISSCAWLPWITELVPPNLRGKYLVRDAATTNFGCFLAFLISAALLAGETRNWQFSLLFAFSAAAGVCSLSFLKRIPDVPIPNQVKTSQTRVPWLEMLRYPPFKKLLHAVIAWSIAYGGMTAFTVAYLRVEVGMSEGKILLITSVAFLGGLSSLGFLGHRLDRLGSKPVLTFSFAAWLVVLAGWIALSGRAIEMQIGVLLGLQFLMGLLAALVNMANNRLAMAVIPKMGRNHFFALYSVLANVTLGLAPIAWGLLIDAVGQHEAMWLGISWNRYTVFFAVASLAFVCSLALSRFLDEPEAASMEDLLREILIQSPQRFWLRFGPRS